MHLHIYPKEKKVIYTDYYVRGMKQQKTSVGYCFSHFSVSMDSILSTYNYLDDDNWIYTPTSEKTADYTMVVESSHFNE